MGSTDATGPDPQRGATLAAADGLSLAPMRALRPAADPQRVAAMLCPPYDVIDAPLRAELLARDAHNVVQVILPEPHAAGYARAADTLAGWVADGTYAPDDEPALYVYEMREAGGHATRGLLGAVELRDPADGVILPHENTMAGPVADRLEVMTATGTDLEPIYLVYDGGGPASEAVRAADAGEPVAEATTADGLTHRLWAIRDAATAQAVTADLAGRRALIADGHHRYATYRERQRLRRESDGPGPWDRGLALLVDSSDYGPQVHAIHRFIAALPFEDAVAALAGRADVTEVGEVAGVSGGAPGDGAQAVDLLAAIDADVFAVALTDGVRTAVITDPGGELVRLAGRPGEPEALRSLDVTVVHRSLVESVWGLRDDVETVGYAHSAAEAVAAAQQNHGVAVLLRPTPVAAVSAVAAAGARMPRKSTLFTPKPASGLVMRRLIDQPADRLP